MLVIDFPLIIVVSGGFDHSSTLIRRYLAAFKLIEASIPLGSSKDEVNLGFTWSEVLGDVSVQSACPNYERACCLYNLSVVLYVQARAADRDSAEGVKEAVRCLQNAAGIVGVIRNEVVPSLRNVQTPDLSPTSLLLLQTLCLAEAQEIFYDKAARDKANRTLLSKLALQTSTYFSQAAAYAKQMNSMDLGNRCTGNEICYLAVAHLQRGLAEKEIAEKSHKGFGALVARFKLAKGVIDRYGGNIPVNAQGIAGIIEREYNAAIKENNVIYLELVPKNPEKELAALESIVAVRPATLTLESIINDLPDTEKAKNAASAVDFDRLVPANVRACADELRTRLSSSLSTTERDVTALRTEVVQWLTKNGLPFSLDATNGNSVSTVPDALWQRLLNLQAKIAPLGSFAVALSNLDTKASTCQSTLNELRDVLNRERNDDGDQRQRYPGRWNRTSSDILNVSYWQSINNYANSHATAVNVNKKISASLSSVSEFESALTSTSLAQVNSFIPALPTSANSEESKSDGGVFSIPEEKALRSALAILADCMDASQASIDAAKHEIESQTAVARSGALMTAYKSKQSLEPHLQSLFQTAVPIVTVPVTTSKEQLKKHFDEAVAAFRTYDSVQKGRNEKKENPAAVWMVGLENAIQVWSKSLSDINEGSTFFNNLTNYLRIVKQQVDDYCMARHTQKQELLLQLGSGNVPTAPTMQPGYGNAMMYNPYYPTH